MEQKELIDRIVADVMARMEARNGKDSSHPGTVSPGVTSVGLLKGANPAPLTPRQLARLIDHTLLKPDAPDAAFDRLCQEAIQHEFFSVCVNSGRVPYVAPKLQGTRVKVCSVVGFPLGAMTSRSKAFETREAIGEGASEIDMVINVGKLKSKDYRAVEEDIRAVRRATRANTVLKVIIETVFLTQDEKVIACELSKKAGADFVKTSTGFLGGGATVDDILLMRSVVGPDMGVKASGGIRTQKAAMDLVAAGATRIGAGAGVALVAGQESSGSY